VQAIMADAFAVRDDSAAPNELSEDAWSAPGWRAEAIEYQRDRGKRPTVVSYDNDEIARLRALMADDISLDRAFAEVGKPSGVATSTLRAAEFLIQQKNPERLRAWLAKHSTEDSEAIRQHLHNKEAAR
jgi:hypothetical protein